MELGYHLSLESLSQDTEELHRISGNDEIDNISGNLITQIVCMLTSDEFPIIRESDLSVEGLSLVTQHAILEEFSKQIIERKTNETNSTKKFAGMSFIGSSFSGLASCVSLISSIIEMVTPGGGFIPRLAGLAITCLSGISLYAATKVSFTGDRLDNLNGCGDVLWNSMEEILSKHEDKQHSQKLMREGSFVERGVKPTHVEQLELQEKERTKTSEFPLAHA